MGIVAETAEAPYLLSRAIEEIANAQSINIDAKDGNNHVRRAIGLLLIALHKRGESPGPIKKRKKDGQDKGTGDGGGSVVPSGDTQQGHGHGAGAGVR